jgi:hypothetical protein
MQDHLISTLFRLWITLQARPMRMAELRAHWREVRRFVRAHPSSTTEGGA